MSSYAGIIKYNYSNPRMLAIGVREQSQKLCVWACLQGFSNVRELKIVTGKDCLQDCEQKPMRIVF